MNGPKFSEVLRTYARGYLAPYDPQRAYQNSFNNQNAVRIISPQEQEAEHIARSVASAFNQLAALYEQYEQYEQANDPDAYQRGIAAQAAQLAADPPTP